MSNNKRDKEQQRITDEFDIIQGGVSKFDINDHLATFEDLPDLGSIELYDYDADLDSAAHKSVELLDSLVDLYFNDLPEMLEHDYIRNRKREDALVYAETLFLQKMTRKNFLVQLRQVDNGDNNSRMHEVINQTIREIRETSKFAATQRADIESSYQKLRNDLLEVVDRMKIEKGGDVDGRIVDSRDLNDYVNKHFAKPSPK